MQLITETFARAEAQMNAMGATEFVSRLYSGIPTPGFTQLKEDWVLGSFACRYNRRFTPNLIWAQRNPPGSKKADFSVFAGDRQYLTDLEILSLFSEPVVDNPRGYEDFCPNPCWRDPADPLIIHIDIDQPRRRQPYARLKRLVRAHLRDEYAPYCLVIWDNDHGVPHPNFSDLSARITAILHTEIAKGRKPDCLRQLWLLDENSPDTYYLEQGGPIPPP